MKDLALLILRLTVGGLLAGHGAQKLFGWFGGYGLAGTGGWLESIGLRPGRGWAALAVMGELGGGLLTALGLFHPLGPVLIFGPMGVATGTVHRGKPIWVAEGGAELPATNMAVALSVILAGPGRYSLDRVLGIRAPLLLAALAAVGVAAGVALAVTRQPALPQAAPREEEAGAQFEAEGGGPSPDLL